MRALTPLGLFALAFAVRVLPWPTVMESGRVVFFGMDAWYHMRRVRLALVSGGWPPSFDPYVNFPHGGQPIWSPFFDALVSWAVWPLHVLASADGVERAAALVPPLLGAACVVLAHRLALRLFDPKLALVAALGLCVLSAHYWYSQIGFLDHHAAEALAATGLLLCAVRLLEPAPGLGRHAATGALAGACLLLWPGMLLHVALIEAALWVACLADDPRERCANAARGLAVLNGVALLVVLPSGLQASWELWSAFSPAVVSRFQPWLFGALGLHAAVCGWLWSRRGSSRGARIATALGLGLALLAASAWAFPELLTGLDEARRWLAKDEVFQDQVKESKPLFVTEMGIDPSKAELRLSRLVYLLPIALVFLARHAWGSPKRRPLLLLVFWVTALSGVTLLQKRFFNSLSPGYALVLAWGGVALWRRRPAGLRSGPAMRALTAAGVSVIVVLALAPMLATYEIPIRNLFAVATDRPMTVPRNELSRRVLLDAAIWMRDHTPPTDSPLDPGARPEYGVLAAWTFGHLIKYAAQRPTVVGNFGDDVGEANLRRVTAYFASREPDAARILDDLRVRYVLVRSLGDVSPERLAGGAMRKRMSVDDSPGLAHHRLVYESLLAGEYLEAGRSEYRIFERVAGARIAGRAPPGTEVRASLGYRSNRGRQGLYRSLVLADSAGRYELRVPYASRGGPPGVQPDAAYRVASDLGAADVVVDERLVRDGGVVPGPDFTRP